MGKVIIGKVILVSYQLNFLPGFRRLIIPDHRFGWSMLSLGRILTVASPIPIGIGGDVNKKMIKIILEILKKQGKY